MVGIEFTEDELRPSIRMFQKLRNPVSDPIKGLEPVLPTKDQERQDELDPKAPSHWPPPHLKNNNTPYSFLAIMMTSSNGNIFRVTGPLCEGNSPVTGSSNTKI